MKDKIYRDPAPHTAREILEEASQGTHGLVCSVIEWGKSVTGALWLKCSCRPASVCGTPDTPETRASLRNAPKKGMV